MASDIYTFKGIFNGHEFQLGCPNIVIDPKKVSTIKDLQNESFNYDVMQKVSSGKIPKDTPIEYTGGWCSSGYAWDADGKDLEETYCRHCNRPY